MGLFDPMLAANGPRKRNPTIGLFDPMLAANGLRKRNPTSVAQAA